MCFEIEVSSESVPLDQDAGISELGEEQAKEGQLMWRGVSARYDVILVSACKWSATLPHGIHSRYGGRGGSLSPLTRERHQRLAPRKRRGMKHRPIDLLRRATERRNPRRPR